MITEALLHCRGIGPARLAHLHDQGVRTWHDVLATPERISAPLREEMIDECQRALDALNQENIAYFVDRFRPQDKWRILAHYLDRATFFDIETSGLDYNAEITVIVCWHRGKLHTFVEHENLDEFLDLLEDVVLLASFNGGSFDVPRVVESFHIPYLPCPHLDLRWLCYHGGFLGGLKQIAHRVGIARPADLADVSGEHAIALWWAWRQLGDETARRQLIRYCAADVVLLFLLAHRIALCDGPDPEELWSQLPNAGIGGSNDVPTAFPCRPPFGSGGPETLRARIRRS